MDKRAEVFITPGVKFEFAGLSFDRIPVGNYNGTPIGNNSTFYAIDIDKKYYYHDGEWVPVGCLPSNLTEEETVNCVRLIWQVYTGKVFLLKSTDDKPGLDVASDGDHCYETDTGKGFVCDEYGVWTEVQRPYNYFCWRPWAQDHDAD